MGGCVLSLGEAYVAHVLSVQRAEMEVADGGLTDITCVADLVLDVLLR